MSISGCILSQPPPQEPAFDVSGVWEGESRVIPCMYFDRSRCNAVNRISFDWRQTGSELSGSYRCAIGNMVCRDANKTTSGTVVSGQISGANINFRLFLEGDLSSCFFNGAVAHSEANGTYSCYQGGAQVEYGVWQVTRRDPG